MAPPRSDCVLLLLVCTLLTVEGVLGLHWGLPTRASIDGLRPDALEAAAGAVAALSAADEAAKRLSSGVIPLADQGSRSQALQEDPREIGRTVRRFALYSCDWDENHTLRALALMRPGLLDFDPRTYIYGGLCIYPVGAMAALGRATGRITLRSGAADYVRHPEDFASLYVGGRLWILLLTVLAAGLVGLSSHAVGGPGCAPLGAALFALLPTTQAWLCLIKPHVAATGFLTAAAVCAAASAGQLKRALSECTGGGIARLGQHLRSPPGQLKRALSECTGGGVARLGQHLRSPPGHARRLTVAWLCVGLGAALVPTHLMFLGLPLLACLRERRSPLPGLALAGTVFVICNPYYFLNRAAVAAEATYSAGLYGFDPSLSNLTHFLTGPMFNSLPASLALLAAIGLVHLLRRESLRVIALGAVVPVMNLVLVSAVSGTRQDPAMVRFALPTLPFLIILATVGVRAVSSRSPRLAALLVIVAIAGQAPITAHYSADRWQGPSADRPPILARAWIQQTLSAGTPVGIRWLPAPRTCPPLDLDRHPLLLRREAGGEGPRPGWWVQTWARPPEVGAEESARFVPGALWTGLQADPTRLPAADPDLDGHVVTFASLSTGHRPLQLHRVPFYVFESAARTSVTSRTDSAGR